MDLSEKKIKILIVDDETLARKKLKRTLQSFPETEVVGEADSVSSALEWLEKNEPDLVLLDIQLGRESGFDIVPVIPSGTHIIFVTAYDKYAVSAFEVNALDYLLKPVQKQRMGDALKKIRSQNGINRETPPSTRFSYEDTLFINTPDVCKFLKISSITSIDAEGSYSHIFEKDGENYLILKSLAEWESILDQKHFIRIHRSHIINKNFAEDVEKWFNYTFRVTITNRQKKLPMSRRRAIDLKLD